MSQIMPAVFVGHGSPMNCISDNAFTRDIAAAARTFPRPRAILVVSAHWQTTGTMVTGSPRPPQIHDFLGFPDELYDFRYASPGDADLAGRIANALGPAAGVDHRRGIDHAAWAILAHMFPSADIPVLELSLDRQLPPEGQFAIGRALAFLRTEGVLVIGSGNIVHNLREVDFDPAAGPYPWAVKFDRIVKDCLDGGDFDGLAAYGGPDQESRRAVPTNEHYLPMLTVLGMRSPEGRISYIHESIQNGSISMRSFLTG